jgi:hypothetical protein
MGKVYEAIDEALGAWIQEQHLFFVATAPLAGDGFLNLSPKGLDTFAILGPRSVAYLDLVGSGAETLAHLRENGRTVLLFCSFGSRPRILRLHGRGEALEPGDPGFDALRAGFPEYAATRAVIRVAVERISDSCGYGVPRYRYEGDRTQLLDWADRKGRAGLARYQLENNRRSLDGLPALRAGTLVGPDAEADRS